MSELQNDVPVVEDNSIKSKVNIFKTFLSNLNLIVLILMATLLLLIFILHFPKTPKQNMWEYKVESFYNDGYSRTGPEAHSYSKIYIDESKLKELGIGGWELVSTSLELETAYPNFGNSEYVTGMQPNVRPQRLLCIFKRKL